MKKKLQIFISSTYTDLIDERQAAVSAILKAGHIPAGMELFTSGDELQMDVIKRWIDDSDIFMLILGGRYGSIEPTTSLSYTELEYDYAVRTGKPHFAVVIEEPALDAKVKKKGKEVVERESAKELKLFREKVLSKMTAFYTDLRDIKLAVHETIGDLRNRHEFAGWVSGAEIPDIQSFTEQINKLRDENSKLLNDNEELKKSFPAATNSVDKPDYEEIYNKLKAIKLRVQIDSITDRTKNAANPTLQTLQMHLNLPKSSLQNNTISVSITTFLRGFSDKMITGIYNRINSNALEMLLYFNVMPKLQTYGLAFSESVHEVAYRRFSLTPQGVGLVKYIRDSEL